MDASVVKIRETGHVRNKAVYVVIGVNMGGNKEVLRGMGRSSRRSEVLATGADGAEERGVTGMFIACVEALKGFPESIATVFPET
jgi:putative transposase